MRGERHKPLRTPARPLVRRYTTSNGGATNGLNGKFGQINVAGGSQTQLLFSFVDSETLAPVSLPTVRFSFLDLDNANDGQECIAAGGFSHVSMGSAVVALSGVTEVEGTPSTLPNATVFCATQRGSGQDNPIDPLALTPLQQNRTVELTFQVRSGRPARTARPPPHRAATPALSFHTPVTD